MTYSHAFITAGLLWGWIVLFMSGTGSGFVLMVVGGMTNNVEAVKKILIEEFTNFVGFRPEITAKNINGGEVEETINQSLPLTPVVWTKQSISNHYDATVSVSNN